MKQHNNAWCLESAKSTKNKGREKTEQTQAIHAHETQHNKSTNKTNIKLEKY